MAKDVIRLRGSLRSRFIASELCLPLLIGALWTGGCIGSYQEFSFLSTFSLCCFLAFLVFVSCVALSRTTTMVFALRDKLEMVEVWRASDEVVEVNNAQRVLRIYRKAPIEERGGVQMLFEKSFDDVDREAFTLHPQSVWSCGRFWSLCIKSKSSPASKSLSVEEVDEINHPLTANKISQNSQSSDDQTAPDLPTQSDSAHLNRWEFSFSTYMSKQEAQKLINEIKMRMS
jgi:hypothetical protein